MNRRFRPALVVAAAVVLVPLGGGVAQALPLGDDDGSPFGDVPLIDGGGPRTCTLTSSDPRSRKSCNHDGGNGRDGASGSSRHGDGDGDGDGEDGHRAYEYDPDTATTGQDDDAGTDVNGAPVRRGYPRAVAAPGTPDY